MKRTQVSLAVGKIPDGWRWLTVPTKGVPVTVRAHSVGMWAIHRAIGDVTRLARLARANRPCRADPIPAEARGQRLPRRSARPAG